MGVVVDRRWTWDDSKRERRRRLKLRWRGALAREKIKWRRDWLMERVIKVKMTFLWQLRVIVERSGEGYQQRWCGFNALILAREGGRRDETLPEDEVEAASSPWLHRKEVWHGVAAWRRRSKERQHQRGKMEETMSVGLTWILLAKKWRKSTQSIQQVRMDSEDLK
jgi:hypothetical protein